MINESSDFPKLASPARRALANAGITQLSQLTEISEKELLTLHGLGPNAVKTLQNTLQKLGLSFREE